MIIAKKVFEDCFIKKNYGKYCFRLGILLLPSASVISAILILFSIVNPIKKNFHRFFDDKLSFGFLFSIPFLFLACFFHYIDNNFKGSLMNSLIGLFNWLPYFFCYLGFQSYLSTKEDRTLISKLLIAGTVPVIFSALTQYFFNWYGPYETLNGLIIWYQREDRGLTGLFSNSNYLSAWLNVILPLTIVQYIRSKYDYKKSCFLFYFTILIIFLIILTKSLDSILCLLLVLLLLFFNNFVIYRLSLAITTFSFIVLSNKFFVEYLEKILLTIFTYLNLDLIHTKLLLRFNAFNSAIDLISKKPIFGYGINNHVSKLVFSNSAFNIRHSHNLFYELALNYGIIVCLLIAIPIFIIFYKAYLINLNLNKTQYKPLNRYIYLDDKSWFLAFFIMLITQLTDIQYYDIKIGMLFWLLLAGTREMIRESN